MFNFSIPFHKFYEYFNSSFDMELDQKMIETVKKKKVPRAMIIKRSYVFAIFISWVLLVTIALSVLNVYNTINILWLTSISWGIIIGFLTISCILLLKASIQYIVGFAKTYGRTNDVHPVEVITEELAKGDEKFRTFFNQISLNIMLFYLLIAFNIWHIVFNIFFANNTDFSSIAYGFFDIVCLWAQIYTMHYYRKRMIDLEMDFNVIVPGEILFVNQSWMTNAVQSLDSDKIKTIKKSTAGMFAQFFNLWSVSVLTEGDQGAIGIMEMYYVDDAWKTVEKMKLLIKEEIIIVKNAYLLKIINHLWIKEIEYDSAENMEILKKFFREKEDIVHADYMAGDVITKSNIEEIYKEIIK